MNFTPGQMALCEGCEREYLDEHEDIYCGLGKKADSSECARWQNRLVARTIARLIGQALDRLPDGEPRVSPYNGAPIEDDDLYEKCRLIERVQDALADYFNESWDDDLSSCVSSPEVTS